MVVRSCQRELENSGIWMLHYHHKNIYYLYLVLTQRVGCHSIKETLYGRKKYPQRKETEKIEHITQRDK